MPHDAIDAFYAELTSLHPEIDDIPEERLDDNDLCPWSAKIDRSPGHMFLSCVWPKARDVKDLLLSLAKKHGVAVFDPQSAQVYYPDIFYPNLLMLIAEDAPTKTSPNFVDVQAAVGRMNLEQGPDFLVLEGRGLDYAQCFGWRGEFTAEWREYNGIEFRHWKAGLRGQVTSGEIFVQGRTHKEEVQPGERLGDADVLAILAAYVSGEGRPEQFQWRDITYKFG